MLCKYLFIIVSLALSGLIDAASVPKVGKRDQGFLKMDFSVQVLETDNDPVAVSKLFRSNSSGTEVITLGNKGYFYVAELYMGSNKQKVGFSLDTGSSDLWTIGTSSGIKSDLGTFDGSDSTTYKNLGTPFEIRYADKTNATGNWSTDDVSLSTDGVTLKDFQFGDATSVGGSLSHGVLGIGYPLLETAPSVYDNFPFALKKAGYINKAAYSLYLDSQDADTGSVLFGGIDNAKYEGKLQSFPIVSEDRLVIATNGYSVNGSTSSPFDAILDSGSTLSRLTSDRIQEVADLLGAKFDGKRYYYDSMDDVPDGVEINFDGLSIKLPKEAIAADLFDSKTHELAKEKELAITVSEFNILGDNFLRQVYAVYDLEGNTIQLAPAKYTDDTDISVIT